MIFLSPSDMFSIYFYGGSEVRFGSFPVYKGVKNMGKSTQKVDKVDMVSK